MNEKRFELVSVCGDFGIIDTITDEVWFFETYESVVKVVDLLNELNDENKELKAEIEQSDSISKDIVCADIQHQLLKVTDENKELKKENEWLRKELKGLNKKYIAFSEATDKRLKEMMKEMMK